MRNKLLSFAVAMTIMANVSAQIDPDIIQKAKAAGVSQEQINAALSKSKSGTSASQLVRDVTLPENATVERKAPVTITPGDTTLRREKIPFGHEIFTSRYLTFAPDYNMATPADYVLGAGDEIVIDVWGASELNVRPKISPEGSITLSGVGPVYLNGLTISEAEERIKSRLNKVFSGIGSRTFVRVTLGQIRSIKVNIAGEVILPGTYTLPSMATLFNALYSAGGVNSIGSLRDIKVFRNSKEVASLDVYDFLINGRYENNVRLEDNDMIIVKPYDALVAITGCVKRNRVYEMTQTETLNDLIRYSGGFTGNAYTENIKVKRKTGRLQEIFTINKNNVSSFGLSDGDSVFVDTIPDEYSNRLLIKGAVWRPGEYQFSNKTDSLSKLIKMAEGLKGNEFATRGQITRRKSDYTYEVIPFNVRDEAARIADIPLQSGDEVYIPTIFDMREKYFVIVKGEVNKPDTLPYRDGMTVEDIIVQGGGLKESASLANIEVARRIKDPESTKYSAKTAEIYTFSIAQNLALSPETSRFLLMPFDEVTIRTSPGYQAQVSVNISGEVLFGGEYVLATAGEKLSDLVKKAGGLSPEAYLKGASLKRKLTEEEMNKVEAMLRMAQTSDKNDSITLKSLNIEKYYSVGINLESAINKPGGDDDIVLEEGDRLFIPKYNGIVKVSGAVLHPNAVTCTEGKSLGRYLSQSGGYMPGARKRPYVVYMNGKVASTKSFLGIKNYPRIEPGCEIVVPMKPVRTGLEPAQIISTSTTAVSLASVVAMLIKLL